MKIKNTIYIICNNDMMVFWTFDEDKAEKIAEYLQSLELEKVNGKRWETNAYWHVHEVNKIPDQDMKE